MPRRIPLIVNRFYHIFNRGVNKKVIFHSQGDYARFHALIRYYIYERTISYSLQKRSLISKDKGKPVVKVLCFCYMPNHFHLLVQMKTEGGILAFMRKASSAYSHYYNLKYRRTGPLFQNRYKIKPVTHEFGRMYVSRYIHRNPFEAGLTSLKELHTYPYSSYKYYLKKRKTFLYRKPILKLFHNQADYQIYVRSRN